MVFKFKWENVKTPGGNYYRTKQAGISLNQFLLRKLPGVFMCNTRNHIFTVKNGVVLSNQPEPGRCILTEIWKVEKITGEFIDLPVNAPMIDNTIKFIKPAPVVEQNKLKKFPWLNNYLE